MERPSKRLVMLLFKYIFKELYHTFKTKSARQFLRLLWQYGDAPRHTQTEVNFEKYTFLVPDCLSFVWQFKEIFVDNFYAFATSSKHPVVFDCGANVGVSVAYFKQKHPNARVVAFEADPKIGQILLQNIKNNRIEGVEIVNKAVWIDDQGVMFGSEAADSSSIFSTAASNRVPSVRLRDLLLREETIDFLKIDIEGAEMSVLADCRDALAHVQHIFVEFHAYIGHPQALAEVVQVLQNAGFRYYIDTNQHRSAPFMNHRYRQNDVMDLQLNIYGYRQ